MPKAQGEQPVKRMADLLKQGAALIELSCPACASPLFKLRSGDIWCAKCEKKVIVVKSEEDATAASGSTALENLEATLLSKISGIQQEMQHTSDAEELQKLGIALSGLLDNLEKIRRVRGK